MAEKSKGHKETKGSPSLKHSGQGQGHGKGHGKEGGSPKPDQERWSVKINGNKQKGQDTWPGAGNNDQQQNDKKGADGLNDYLQQPLGGKGMPIGGTTNTGCLTKIKNGCFPKTLLLVFPFFALGAFLLFRL